MYFMMLIDVEEVRFDCYEGWLYAKLQERDLFCRLCHESWRIQTWLTQDFLTRVSPRCHLESSTKIGN